MGPVTDAPDWIAQRARFHADTSTATDVDYDLFVAELNAADRRLAASAEGYDRVVIWTEHDSHDQLSLIRCLAHYARTGPPRPRGLSRSPCYRSSTAPQQQPSIETCTSPGSSSIARAISRPSAPAQQQSAG